MFRSASSAAALLALCTTAVTPAFAQDYRFSGFDAPRGATATVNLKVPLGAQPSRAKPSYGLTLGYGHAVGSPSLDGRTITRGVRFADLRFDRAWRVQKAELATFDLANLDDDRRLNLMGGGKKSWLIIGGIIVAGVLICVAADCFDDDDDEDSPGTSGS